MKIVPREYLCDPHAMQGVRIRIEPMILIKNRFRKLPFAGFTEGSNMCLVRSSLSLLLVGVLGGNVWTQQNGDYVVVLRKTAVDDGGGEKQHLPAGDLVRAYNVREDAVWVSGK